MKWSEQMRVLNSEDEHYNKLIYDIGENALYINEKLIATLDEQKTLYTNKFLDLKKKYPYIDDKNFLLNCLFKLEEGTTGYTSQEGTSNLITCYYHPSNVQYKKSNMGTVIDVRVFIEDTTYKFTLLKADIDR